MVLENMNKTINIDDKEYRYDYKLILDIFNNKDSYGIEVERNDFENGELVKSVKDCIYKISCHKEKVSKLRDILYLNIVSPIHLVDIIGEFVDEFVYDFEDTLEFNESYN